MAAEVSRPRSRGWLSGLISLVPLVVLGLPGCQGGAVQAEPTSRPVLASSLPDGGGRGPLRSAAAAVTQQQGSTMGVTEVRQPPAPLHWPSAPLRVALRPEGVIGTEGYGPHVAFAPDGRWASSSAGVLNLFAGLQPQGRYVLPGSTRGLAFATDGRTVLVAPELFDLQRNAPLPLPPLFPAQGRRPAPTMQVQAAAFSPDGSVLAVYAWHRPEREDDGPGGATELPPQQLLLLDGRTRERKATLDAGDQRARDYQVVAVSERHVAAAREELGLWDRSTGQELLHVPAHRGFVQQLCFGREGRLLLSSGVDGQVMLWNVAPWERRLAWPAHPARTDALALHPIDPVLATGSRDGELRLWQLTEPPRLLLTERHTGPIEGLAFSPDGRRLVVAERGAVAQLVLYALTVQGAKPVEGVNHRPQ